MQCLGLKAANFTFINHLANSIIIITQLKLQLPAIILLTEKKMKVGMASKRHWTPYWIPALPPSLLVMRRTLDHRLFKLLFVKFLEKKKNSFYLSLYKNKWDRETPKQSYNKTLCLAEVLNHIKYSTKIYIFYKLWNLRHDLVIE